MREKSEECSIQEWKERGRKERREGRRKEGKK